MCTSEIDERTNCRDVTTSIQLRMGCNLLHMPRNCAQAQPRSTACPSGSFCLYAMISPAANPPEVQQNSTMLRHTSPDSTSTSSRHRGQLRHLICHGLSLGRFPFSSGTLPASIYKWLHALARLTGCYAGDLKNKGPPSVHLISRGTTLPSLHLELAALGAHQHAAGGDRCRTRVHHMVHTPLRHCGVK